MKRLLILPIMLVALFILSACEDINLTPNGANQEEQARFETVMEILKGYHYSEPSEEDLWQGAIQGMIDSLEDPYSVYFTEEQYQRFRDSLGETFVGVGVTVENVEDNVVIQKVWSDSPAERAGLRAGDVVTHVDGEDYRDESYLDTLLAVQGEEGSEVELGVDRSGVDEILFMTMTREQIENPTVTSFVEVIDGKPIGFISINTFGDQTYDIFKDTLETMENDDAIEGLVVDLRNNGGGRLDTVLNLLDLFLIESDKPMFATESFHEGSIDRTEYDASGDERKPYEIVTIINEYSASASEVFAAGMKQHGGYEVIGMPSYGKGTMQTPFSHPNMNEDELHLSNGIWLTPNDVWVNHIDGDQSSVYPTISVERSAAFETFNIYLLDETPLRYDTVDERNAQLQIKLNALGYGDVRTDSYFDEATRDAVEAFQQGQGLSVSGEVDSETAIALNEAILDYRNDHTNDPKITAAFDFFLD